MKTSAAQRMLVTLVALVLLVFQCGCSRTPAGSIEHVLNQCARITQEASGTHRDNAATAGFVADRFQTVDTRGCPPEFRLAFQEHVKAWRQAQYAFANNTVAANFVEGAVAGLSGDYSNVGQTMGAASQAGQDINSTYYQLTAIAAAYSARVPLSTVQ